ncbi:sugar ABC transporter ATP-binding protein [Marinovum sp. 2_MG-2023]|uniref:sugar ABC transporter ATP-binding protein n=1 Tax=unclassified Marinovum TaxID=2647166 RepID=UPI0026E19CAF|nr:MULTISPECIES: sugar ABC transporter ATP-binding protein [unclassified Marinovum]MDO6732746.1 sugar ABC transporter ATP-binding protein [Marinovum sp. 2_MG-2023]MDO6782020.1 sugar ABC transporter ATP-binding protein [Marinovum sp. 1_MG-2023]
MNHHPLLWELEGITKVFPGVRANDGISIKLRAGEIHALLGENGCGKSTLIKILSGVHQPDGGTIRRQGEVVHLTSPIQAREQGVATVFQEFSLVPTLTVAENIFLGRYPRQGPLVDWRRMILEAEEVLGSLDISIAPDRIVGTLSVAEQQLVEIAKAISIEATLLILDEPSTALGEQEIVALHKLLRRMKERGVSILYISHRLDEVVSLVDTATILKDGKVVSCSEGTALDVNEIVSKMVGEDIDEHYPKQNNTTEEVLFSARNLATANGVQNVSFDVKRGEVYGLGGVIGSGRTEIARAIFGIDPLTRGNISIDGRAIRIRNPRDAIRSGLALVPENRKSDGLFFNFNGGPNITTAALDKIRGHFLLKKRSETQVTRDYIDQLEISPAAATKFVNLLSGGNQQKVVIARWLFAGSRVLILDEPTQGIDIGAKIAVYNLINALTARGCAVILISSDHNELIAMSDRIGIIRHGALIETRPADDVTHAQLVQASAQPLAKDAA